MANYIKGRLKERHAPSEHATARVHMQCKLFTVWSIRWKHGEMEKRLSEPFTRNSPSNCEAVVSQSAARSVPDIIVKSFEDLYTQHPDLFEVSASNWNLILSPVSLPLWSSHLTKPRVLVMTKAYKSFPHNLVKYLRQLLWVSLEFQKDQCQYFCSSPLQFPFSVARMGSPSLHYVCVSYWPSKQVSIGVCTGVSASCI